MSAVLRPTSLASLASMLAVSPDLVPVAGGTDLLIDGRALSEGPLLDLSRVEGMDGITLDPGRGIEIGAATRVARLAESDELARHWPMLSQAAASCGAVQIRNRATIGGNIANAAPAADLLPPLILAGANLRFLEAGSSPGEATVEAFRPRRSAIITHVDLPCPEPGIRSAFVKLGLRDELTISRLNLAMTARFEGGVISAARLVAGALGPRPIRLERAAAVLEGRAVQPETLCTFLDALTAEVEAAIPVRASAPWKARAIRGLGLDLLAALMGADVRAHPFDKVI